MSLQRFLEPLSPDDPCGPDLFEAMDDALDTYLLDAEERLPQQFFDGAGKLRVEPGTIKLEAELAAAAALLERTRDLRVLAWLAQFCAVGRHLEALVDCIELMAGLLENYGSQVHPRTIEDEIDRCNALEMLDGAATMRLPLEFMPLARDRRLNMLSWRKFAIADGRRNPVAEDGQTLEIDTLMAALRAAENADQVTASHALIRRLKDGLSRVEHACLLDEDRPFRPNLEKVQAQIDAMITLLHDARPDLAGGDAGDQGATTGEGVGEAPIAAAGAAVSGGAGAPVAPAAAAPGSIANALQARHALEALEGYFSRHEPSSPSFVLVRQARQLQGRPLVEALQLLVPDRFDDARIDFSRDTGFVLTMERMRALSDIDITDSPEEAAAEPPVVTTRGDAANLMSALERFFAATEPSSPIPLLLTRARGYLNQSFSAILAELFPPRDD
ncbi:ImpA family type VI secretion system protein [Roseinatronobacter alkalisoli]|uniref:Type VI secretion system ImpA family N-terminal domain-containing protein n=1 Tax=Roseinatronobacter alkalisoli TaxID=3028235 RepID=A0ABT5TCM9_9RHOB|nr:type VI secretion system ImpA family N-terminal domain-containing protein [Roseinatronobacter sp. HJB301]MDD7972878.1 type VI secretion system ImpA family N-terminal domain-containing protein [Roseinatronobacter sp. HJB301]